MGEHPGLRQGGQMLIEVFAWLVVIILAGQVLDDVASAVLFRILNDTPFGFGSKLLMAGLGIAVLCTL